MSFSRGSVALSLNLLDMPHNAHFLHALNVDCGLRRCSLWFYLCYLTMYSFRDKITLSQHTVAYNTNYADELRSE